MPRKNPIQPIRKRLAELVSLMEAHGLDTAHVAKLTDRKPSTVRVWLSGAQGVPLDCLRILRLSLSDHAAEQRKLTA